MSVAFPFLPSSRCPFLLDLTLTRRGYAEIQFPPATIGEVIARQRFAGEGHRQMQARINALRAIQVGTLAGATVFFYCMVLSPVTWGQDAAEPKHAEAIPRGSYRTWSLFLVCNSEWLLPASNQRLKDLYDQFQAFGTAIGPDHLAVWFWKGKPNPSSPRLAADLDVDRSTQFAGPTIYRIATALTCSSPPCIPIRQSTSPPQFADRVWRQES